MTNEELDILWFKAMRQSVEEDKAFIRYYFAALVAAAEREKVAAWMRSKSYVTGHGDTTEDLLKELEWQVAEREREACVELCLEHSKLNVDDANVEFSHLASYEFGKQVGAATCATAIRARGEQEQLR